MGFFIGTYQHSFDDKNRVIVPARLRDMIDVSREGEGLYVSPGRPGCLYLFTRSDWMETAQRLTERAKENPTEENQNYRRIFFADSEQVNWDKQGRVLVPETLRSRAGLGKDAVFVGNGDRIELWDREAFEQFHDQVSGAYEDFAKGGF